MGVGPLCREQPAGFLFAISSMMAVSTICLPLDAILGLSAIVLGTLGVYRAKMHKTGLWSAVIGCILGLATVAGAIRDFGLMASGWSQ